jgi:hypothetical protein
MRVPDVFDRDRGLLTAGSDEPDIFPFSLEESQKVYARDWARQEGEWSEETPAKKCSQMFRRKRKKA